MSAVISDRLSVPRNFRENSPCAEAVRRRSLTVLAPKRRLRPWNIHLIALVSPEENLFIGSLDALTNQPIQMSLVFQEGSVADLTAASADVQSVISLAESELSVVIPDLASGDVAGAAADFLGAGDLLVVLSPELVFEGLAGSLGL
jgi:hypothetical protein